MRSGKVAVRTLVLMVLRALAAGLLLAGGLLPSDWPWAVGVCGGLALLLVAGLWVEWLNHRWLRGEVGRPPGLDVFLLGNLPALLLMGALVWSAATLFSLWRLPLAAGLRESAWQSLAGASVVMLVALGMLVGRDRGEPARLARELSMAPLRTLWAGAWTFQRGVARRSFGTLLRLYLVTLVAMIVSVCLGAGLAWVGLWWGGGWTATTWMEPPFLLVAGVGVAVAGVFLFVHALLLTLCRLVSISGELGWMGAGRVWHEADTAIGTLGWVATAFTSWFFGILVAVFGFGALQGVIWLEDAGWSLREAWLVSGAVALLALWVLVVVPATWVLPILVDRDCGWIRALIASTALCGVRPLRTLEVSLLATAMGATVVLLPGAAALLVAARREVDPLVSLLLGERALRDVRSDIEAMVVASNRVRPAVLTRAYNALEAGRYLEALNGFQMFLLQNFGHPDAVRGEVLSLLHLGNTGVGRERLERWCSME
ncbi:MAG: hypothetical protein KF858_01830, partial [Candidatus Sumerlaeia bacterium]|nr:hypothetical protein [Candidatus Sumerlaeia bacterium]